MVMIEMVINETNELRIQKIYTTNETNEALGSSIGTSYELPLNNDQWKHFKKLIIYFWTL